jgi:hypothetical protein
MSDAVMKLLPQVQALSEEEWLELCQRRDDTTPSNEGWEEEWAEEINQRMADVASGRTQLLDGDEVMARLRAKHGINR